MKAGFLLRALGWGVIKRGNSHAAEASRAEGFGEMVSVVIKKEEKNDTQTHIIENARPPNNFYHALSGVAPRKGAISRV